MWFLAPLIAAAASMFAGRRAAEVQGSRARRAQEDQRLNVERQDAAVKQQEARAAKEREQLQREESDKLRGMKRKGRRSLLSGDETGVQSGLRSTLG